MINKLALWSPQPVSNQRPLPYQGSALPLSYVGTRDILKTKFAIFILSASYNQHTYPKNLERVMGIEPTSSAWKAKVLPLNYTRCILYQVEGEGFEPSKAEPADLQSAPFDRSGTPPNT